MENAILYVFLLAALIQAIFYLLVFTPILLPQNKVKNKNNANLSNSEVIPLSVIICAKNEKDNLLNHLPQILTQDYPNFEVIVVDDGSNDGTSQLLIGLQEKHAVLKVFTLEPAKKVLPEVRVVQSGVAFIQVQNVDQVFHRINIKNNE
jgi:cellulose synthase/poly-beta-1,6-N-acetylglucosamine synthase-like glycosyltransferase